MEEKGVEEQYKITIPSKVIISVRGLTEEDAKARAELLVTGLFFDRLPLIHMDFENMEAGYVPNTDNEKYSE